MKIDAKTYNKFGTIKPGTPFWCVEEDGEITYWMKTVNVVSSYNAVNLETGDVDAFMKDTPVNVMNGKFVEE